MLNAYYDLRRSSWIACAIVHGEWIEGDAFPTWESADRASGRLVAAAWASRLSRKSRVRRTHLRLG
jgi:hypothetical protein